MSFLISILFGVPAFIAGAAKLGMLGFITYVAWRLLKRIEADENGEGMPGI